MEKKVYSGSSLSCYNLPSQVSQHKTWKEKGAAQQRTSSKVKPFPYLVFTKFAMILASVFTILKVFKTSQSYTLIYPLEGLHEKGNLLHHIRHFVNIYKNAT